MSNPRIPENIKKLRGTQRKSRKPPTLKVSAKMPRKPAWLDAKAAGFWDIVAPQLVREGLLSPLFASTFALLCQSWSMYLDAQSEIAENGLTIRSSHGNLKPHPALAIARRERSAFLELAKQFGLTVLARQAIRTEKPKKHTPFLDMLQNPK